MLIINKYIGLSDVEKKCNDENILKQVDSIMDKYDYSKLPGRKENNIND